MSPWIAVAGAAAALIGNNWPVWLRFKGGKGASVSMGAGLAVTPLVAASALVVWGAILIVTRYVSAASLVAVSAAPLASLFLPPPRDRLPSFVLTFIVALIVIYKHRANIGRLRGGAEPKIRGFPGLSAGRRTDNVS